MKLRLIILLFILSLYSCDNNRTYELELLATNDVHGRYFTHDYKDGSLTKTSLANVSKYVNDVRAEVGDESVLLIDVGDHLQGDNASYYYNFVDSTGGPHLFSSIAEYMRYDVVVVGNHDIEAGHPVYDKIKSEMNIPYLAANAISKDDGKPYFPPYTILNKAGLKIAVIGMTSPNIAKWLAPHLWEGISFIEIYPLAQTYIDQVNKDEKPDLTILAIHAGLGDRNEYSVEHPALFLASKLTGVDMILASHDHKKIVEKIYNGKDSVLVIEAGDRCNFISNVSIEVVKEDGEIIEKNISARLIEVSVNNIDEQYVETFKPQYDLVREYNNKEIGRLSTDIQMSNALDGMSDVMSLIHLVQLSSGADISFAAPLTLRGVVKKGILTQDDLFTLYKFENHLYVVEMTGREIKQYLEESYDKWINSDGPYFNYDSAAGLNYTVSKSAKKGNRVKISSLADGSRFNLNKKYKIAMNSYRASGAGDLIKAANITNIQMEKRILKKMPEVRDILYDYIVEVQELDPGKFKDNGNLGSWNFVK